MEYGNKSLLGSQTNPELPTGGFGEWCLFGDRYADHNLYGVQVPEVHKYYDWHRPKRLRVQTLKAIETSVFIRRLLAYYCAVTDEG